MYIEIPPGVYSNSDRMKNIIITMLCSSIAHIQATGSDPNQQEGGRDFKSLERPGWDLNPYSKS